MNRLLPGAVFTLLLFCQSGFGQVFPSQLWHKGHIVTQNDTLRGVIRYDLVNDVVQIEREDKILTFTPESVSTFRIFDEYLDSNRTFYSLPYRERGYSKSIFFELLYGGNIALICREHEVIENRIRNSYYNSGLFYAPKAVLEFSYFMMDEKGKIRSFGNKKNSVLNITKPYSDKIRQYIKVNQLKATRRTDLIKIIAYYDSLL